MMANAVAGAVGAPRRNDHDLWELLDPGAICQATEKLIYLGPRVRDAA